MHLTASGDLNANCLLATAFLRSFAGVATGVTVSWLAALQLGQQCLP